MDNDKIKYIVINESVVGSVIKDIVTFLMFAGLLLFNHQFLNGSIVIDTLFIILVLLWLAGKRSKNYFTGTKEEVIKYLSEEK